MLRPGDTIGILGGGQLGRMLALAAAEYGLKAHIFAPEMDSPAFDVAARHTCARYDDGPALAAFAASVAVVTYEFENVPLGAIDHLTPRVPVRPGRMALEKAQDRLAEKRFLNELGIATAPFAEISGFADLTRAAETLGLPLLLKARRFGYDGKGQARLGTLAESEGTLEALGHVPAIGEGLVPFTCESSIIAARAIDGTIAAYEPGTNRHAGGILRDCVVDGTLPADAVAAMTKATGAILTALDYVGVIGVEFFLIESAEGTAVLANEFAPRVHNTGHWTMDGAMTSQFHQHIRAIAGWPLGATTRLGPIRMDNLIGDDSARWPALLAEPGAQLHLYGKGEARAGRKMGHVNRLIEPGFAVR